MTTVTYTPATMSLCELPGEDGVVLSFTGRLVDFVDNDSGERPRWAELRLYKKTVPGDDSGEEYLIYTVGHSLIVHDVTGTCNMGVRVPARRFPEKNEDYMDLEPCPVCTPDLSGLPFGETDRGMWREIPDGKMFNLEITWYWHTVCPTAEIVVDSLRKCLSCGHRSHRTWVCACKCPEYKPGYLTAPGLRLMEQCSVLDDGISDAYRMVKRI